MSSTLLHGSAQSHLATLTDACVDCVLSDPPYGETSLSWDKRCGGWMQEIRRVLKRHGSVWVFGSFRYFFDCTEEFSGWRIAQDIVWEKHNGSNPFKDRFRRVHELAVQFYPEDVPWSEIYKNPLTSNDATARTVRQKARPQQWGAIGGATYESHDGGPRLLRSILYHPSEHGRAIHPTQKPVAICEALLAYSCVYRNRR